ncbi:MAG: type I-U CRISPR-associated RAMP protein Csb1/Cas7u [Bryobacteraceae bacterium]
MTPEMKAVPRKLTPAEVLNGPSPCVLTAVLVPVAGWDRFQPAGFPEVGHVIYKAPRGNGTTEHICIVDSAASMANHLESVCIRGAHDYELVGELDGMPYLRCVTDSEPTGGEAKEVVVTSLTEGHRLASTYFLGGQRLRNGVAAGEQFADDLATEFGIVLRGEKNAHPPAEKWWQVFKTIFKYDPNTLVHGVLFPQWQIRISRVLTAHLEAFGAARVDRSGVKFDRLGKTTSGQPIFAVDDATAREIRATFVLDVALLKSFGRRDGQGTLGLSDTQKEFLAALALWKIRALLSTPFRFRSGCHLQLDTLKQGDLDVEIEVCIQDAIRNAGFRNGESGDPVITDVYWPRAELYRKATERVVAPNSGEDNDSDNDNDEDESE